MGVGVMDKWGGEGEGIALEILPELPAAARVPRRIRERLLPDYSKTPPSAQDIEAKLRHAHLRRQQFYNDVSRKARPKYRSRSYSPSPEEELGQRIEARLLAAEQKRSNILAEAQMRLARLDELRQAAKTGVQMRFERERMKLGRRVESRVQKAEANRMRILKASYQKRACVKERISQSMHRRIARESKYKERVRASIHQKRAAAEKKRLGLLEAEKKKAHARVLQVRHVAQSVSHQREIERSRMRDRLEDKLQRAKRQRAEFLRQRRRQRDSISLSWNSMHDAADLLSRKLAKCWRCFVRWKRTTSDLAKDYNGLKINESLPFEQLAILIESPVTLKTVKSLLDRLEIRIKVPSTVASAYQKFVLDNIDHLLKRVATPRRRINPTTSSKSREEKKVFSASSDARTSVRSPRYPVRVVLSAYMILGHPDAVFSVHGEQEAALNKAAEGFVRELRLLIKVIQEGPVQFSDRELNPLLPKFRTFRSQLGMFDEAWCAYLNSFVVWKVKDARLLEEDLVRAACQLELSMIQKCKLTPEGDDGILTHDMKAIQKQVTEDQKLLREKVRHLSGDAGIKRMECALSETRSRYFQAKENGSPIGSPLACFFSPSPSSPVHSMASSSSRSRAGEGVGEPSGIVRSLFREDNISSSRGFGSSRLSNYSLDELRKENELIVNEFLHEWNCMFSDESTVGDEENNMKTKIRQSMEKAFWDCVMESLQAGEPDYGCILQLVREVRDELYQMVPQGWKAEITESIDLELLAQLLKSGGLDVEYLGKTLEFALVTLRKLSAPANDDEMISSHQKLLEELRWLCQGRDESGNLQAVAIVRGIRFILEQIQALKREISIARIRILEPLLKGPAGFDYLRQAFEKHYGSPSQAHNSLPLTRRWMASLITCEDEWEDHRNTLSALTVLRKSSTGIPLSVSLKTGGTYLFPQTSVSPSAVTNATGGELSKCKGERVDLSIRLGLLKMLMQVSGITQEVLPETFLLNLSRLRAIQAQIQKIIVVSTSTLVWRQILLREEKVRHIGEMESISTKCVEKLFELLDGKEEEVEVREIVETMCGMGAKEEEDMGEKVESRKRMMRGLVRKSLEEGDAVYEKVARCIYNAARGVVLEGNGDIGKELVNKELSKVGGGGDMLKERLVETAQKVGVAACVSVRVHGPWYTHLVRRIHHQAHYK